MFGARGIFQREIDVLRKGTPQGHRRFCQLPHLVTTLPQFHLSMQGRDADKWLNGGPGGNLHRVPGSLNIERIGTRNGANLGIVHLRGDQAHRFKLSRRGDGKAAVQRIEAHICQRLCNGQLLFWKVVDAWGLLTVAQGGFVKFDDAWFRRHRL